eukprot:1115503-Rhodomonas_salina.1
MRRGGVSAAVCTGVPADLSALRHLDCEDIIRAEDYSSWYNSWVCQDDLTDQQLVNLGIGATRDVT